MRKAQSSIEFIILIGVIAFIFLTFLFVLNMNLSDEHEENRTLFVKEIALAVQNEITLATNSIDGYRREFQIPINLFGLDYTAEIVADLVYIHTTDGRYALSLPVSEVSGTLQTGINVITKKEGVVYLNANP